MNNQELLDKIIQEESYLVNEAFNSKSIKYLAALRSIVILHDKGPSVFGRDDYCLECDVKSPCPTIIAIGQALN